MAGELRSLNVSFKVLNSWPGQGSLKGLQELGHAPSDFSSSQDGTAKSLADSGYTGPGYETEWHDDLQDPLNGKIQVGLALGINNTPGAPMNSFVYGAAWEGGRYLLNQRNMIKCSLGPAKDFFVNVRDYTTEEQEGTVTATNTQREFLAGLGAGRGSGGVYIASHEGEIPANVPTQKFKNDAANWYTTNNIWNIYDYTTNSVGVVSGRYIAGQGATPANSLMNRAYIRQVDGGKVQFMAANSKARIYRCKGNNGGTITDIPISLKGKWFITGDYGAYEYLYGKQIPIDLAENGQYAKTRPVAIGGSNNVFDVVKDQVVSTGFVMDLTFNSKNATDVYRGGYPSIEIMIGSPNDVFTEASAGNVSVGRRPNPSNIIKWAKVALTSNRPPMIMFPVIVTNGSRYIKSELNSSNQNYSMQYITGQKSIKSDASEVTCKVKYELFGDIGSIEISGGVQLNAVIAPQMSAFNYGLGQTVSSDSVLDCWCGILGYADLTVTNCNGQFSMAPLCYMSWDPQALMFKHQKFDLSWSGTLDTMSSASPDAFAQPQGRYGYAENAEAPGNSDSRDRYPDIVRDARMGITNDNSIGQVISLMTMARIPMGGTPSTNTIAAWGTHSNVNGTPFSGNLGAVGDSASFIIAHSSDHIKKSNMYPMPQYGSSKDAMAQYTVPTCAIWSHLFCNSQLVTVWPKFDHKTWVARANSNNLSGRNGIFESNSSAELNSEVISYSLNSELKEYIIKNTLNISILNPNSDTLNRIFQTPNVMDSSRIWIQFDSSANTNSATVPGKESSSSVNQINFKGIVTNMVYTSVGAGIQVDITAQDPFSLMMSELIYPKAHRIDGWPVDIAVPYLLLRTGFPCELDKIQSASGLRNSDGSSINIGRYIMSDYKAASVAFSQTSLESNLSKAIGPALINKYPVFYYDHKNNIIKYKDLYNSSYLKINDWDRLTSSDIFNTFNYNNGTTEQYLPYERGTFKLNINNSKAYNQILFKSKDRFRNSPIIFSSDIGYTSIKSGYKNFDIYNFENTISSISELRELVGQIDLKGAYYTPMSVNFAILGMLRNDISNSGGCGIVENKIIPNMDKSQGYRQWLLRSTTISWKAESNQVKTEANYEVRLPSIMQLGNTLVSK